jgi:DNA recombination protein Rad52
MKGKQVISMTLTKQQHEILLKGINGDRIAQRKGGGGRALSYLEAWDVKAHMNRVFGFLNWSADVMSAELAYEDNSDGRWNVGYKVILTLKVNGATYTEAAVGSATLPSRGEAHDMAIKTAESDAFKRAAINLGDQFGLSLYNNGSTQPVVKQTLVAPAGDE